MKVFVIGPIYPFRGGIAHFTRMLCECLSKRHNVTAISFSRLYPKFLFPGREQKETSADETFSVKTEYLIDSINPLSWISAANKIKKEKPDYVIFQWWHSAFFPAFWAISWLIRGSAKKVLVFHNFLPHDKSHGLHEPLVLQLCNQMDSLCALSSSVAKDLKTRIPHKPSGWITEPSYDQALINDSRVTRLQAREELGLSGNVLLFFGFVRPYKGLHYLIDAMPKVLEQIPMTLVIAGEFWGDKSEYEKQIADSGLSEHIRIVDQYIPSDRVQYFFKASDAIVLPYISSTNSAVLKMAFGFNIVPIATAVGPHEDLVIDQKTGILVPPKDPAALANAIIDLYSKNRFEPIKAQMALQKGLFEWTLKKEKILFNTLSTTDLT